MKSPIEVARLFNEHGVGGRQTWSDNSVRKLYSRERLIGREVLRRATLAEVPLAELFSTLRGRFCFGFPKGQLLTSCTRFHIERFKNPCDPLSVRCPRFMLRRSGDSFQRW